MATAKATPPPRRRKKASSNRRSDNDDITDGFGIENLKAEAQRQEKRAAAPAADDTTNYTGTTIHVTWGKEHIQPIRFQGMDIGPFAMDVVVLDGETPLDAKRRAMRHLNHMAQEELEEKMPRFIKRCQDAATDL